MKNDARDETTTDWSRRLAVWLYDHRTAALAACLVLAAGAAVPATKVGVDNAVQRWFPDGAPALADYRDFQDTFGNDERVVVALMPEGGALSPKGFRVVRRATRAARRVEGVAGVTSLSSLPATIPFLSDRSSGGSFSERQANALRRTLQADSMRRERKRSSALGGLPPLLLGPEGQAAGLLVRMVPHDRIDGQRGHTLTGLERALRGVVRSGGRVAMAGTGVILDALNRAAMGGSALLILAANVLVFLLLWVLFGRLGPVLVTMAAVGVATLWLLGAYGLAGGTFNTVTMVMPTLVLVITTADCVHLLLRAARLDVASPRERTVRTVGFLLRPCAFTTLTTAAGFLALTASSMPVVRALGAFSALGLAGGLVASVVACTWALCYDWAVPKQRDGLERAAGRLAAFGMRRRRTVLAGTMLLVVGAAAGVVQLRADTDSLGYLFKDHPARQDSRFVERRLGPYLPLEFVVRVPPSSEGGDALQPALLRKVSRWERSGVRQTEAGWAWSAADVLRRLHVHLPNGRAALPQNERRFGALLNVARRRAGSLLQRFVAPASGREPARLRVTFGVPVQSARGLQRVMRRLAEAADLPAGASAEPSGYLPLYTHMMQRVVRSQIWSFAAALVLITGMIGLLFRSVRAALVSLAPNLLPLALTLGLMGAVGIPLDAATATIAAVALGLIVDDTVHLLHRHFRQPDAHPKGARSLPLTALRQSVAAVGAPLMGTTLVLAGGFAVLLLAPIKSVVWFGLLIGAATLLALAADLVVTPALLAVLPRRLSSEQTSLPA